MAKYNLRIKESIQKDLSDLPKAAIKKILQRIASLAANPRPPGCEKLTGQDRYRVRLGCYRIVYTIQDDVLTFWVVKVSHRKDVYRRQ